MSDADRIRRGNLQVAAVLDKLIAEEILPGTGVDLGDFWRGFESILAELGPRNRALLAEREALQKRIDDWHLARRGQPIDPAEYKAFLVEIGYLIEEPAPFTIRTENVDDEIAHIAGPQLVVPVMNARFSLNA
ncbi:MAG: malate synthase G, partial [Pseudomonadales bacterium]